MWVAKQAVPATVLITDEFQKPIVYILVYSVEQQWGASLRWCFKMAKDLK